jgi:hypothetical protein
MAKKTHEIALSEPMNPLILFIREQRVMLDSDLARVYAVPSGALNRAVKRNGERFPEDFMFQLTPEEADSLRCQTAILKIGRGQHRKYLPYAFTDQPIRVAHC